MGNKIISGDQSVDVSLDHPKISSATLITRFDRSILRLKVPSDDQAYKIWKTLVDKYENLSHENLFISSSHKFQKQGICSTQGLVEMDFPAYPFLLNSEIHQRKIKSILFTQSQLWYLIYSFLSVRSYFQSIRTSSGESLISDIRPENVFISPNGFVKFVSRLSWPGEKSAYSKTFDSVIAYLSPQDMQLLQFGKLTNGNLQNRSQDFAIGLTLLASALLVDNRDLYDMNTKQFNEKLLNKRFYQLYKNTESYSDLLKSVIYGLCAVKPQNRLLSNELWQWLKTHEKQILRKQQFVSKDLPSRMNQKLNEFKYLASNLKVENERTSSPSQRTNSSGQNNIKPFQARQVARSFQGYYSPRLHTNINSQQQQVKVFIQYRSPGKQLPKPRDETVSEKSPSKQVKSSVDQLSQIKVKANTENNNQSTKIIEYKSASNQELILIKESQSSVKQQPSIAKQMTSNVKDMNSKLIFQVFKQVQSKQQDKVVNNNEIALVNQQILQQITFPVIEQFVAVSFPVPQRQIKIHSSKTLVDQQQKSKLKQSDDPKYFSLIEPMIPVKKVVKKKQAPVMFYDSNSQTKIVGLKLDVSESNKSKDNKDESVNNNITEEQKLDQNNIQPINELDNQMKKRSSLTQKKDFLDHVMDVNKALNNEQDKNYEKGNKFLNDQHLND